jgi:hypothetical protein
MRDAKDMGKPVLVCRTCRRTLVGGFLLAAVSCGLGAAVLIFVVYLHAANGNTEVFGTIILLAVAAVPFYGGWVLCRKTSRLRRVQVVAYEGGLTYQGTASCESCRWDQVEDVRYKVSDHYSKSASLYGVVNASGSTTRDFTHTTHEVTVRRSDGLQYVFSDELDNVTELARFIVECVNQTRLERLRH